jgi:glycosyltransferase involved in cell wall biosynthesis
MTQGGAVGAPSVAETGPRRTRIMVVSWRIPPETTGSSVIVGNLAKEFSAEEMVVVGESPVDRPPVRWQAGWPRLVNLIDAWPQDRRGSRWYRRLLLPVALARSIRIARENDIDAIVGVFPNGEFLLLSYLTARAVGARLYPYYHNTYVENRTGGARRLAKRIQDRVFAEASHVFVMSEGMVELFRERYPNVACSALVHPFPEELPEFEPPPPIGTPARFVICGNVNESCKDAAVRVAEVLSSIPGTQLTLVSGTSRAYLRQIGVLREGVGCETVSRDDVVARLRAADVVVLPHGFHGGLSDEEYRTIFPTKTIEYLICGRPILAHMPREAFLTRFLREHGCALVVDEADPAALRRGIETLLADAELRATLVRRALEAAQMFQGRRVAAHLRSVVLGAVGA